MQPNPDLFNAIFTEMLWSPALIRRVVDQGRSPDTANMPNLATSQDLSVMGFPSYLAHSKSKIHKKRW
jgi:hypothetical protein